MSLTSADWLKVVGPRLTGPLFNPENVARRLRRLAGVLPGDCSATLEARLASGIAPVDLSVCLRTADQAQTLAARLPSSPTKSVLSLWSEGSLAQVRSVWLEFDLDRELEEAELRPSLICAKLPRDADSGWLVGTLVPLLMGRRPTSRQRGLVLRCLGALPDAARLLYVFSLPGRGNDAVRLEIFGLEPAQILDYLWEVAPRTVPGIAQVAPLFVDTERLHLSFDVAEEVLPRIGIEGSFPRQPHREPRWACLLTRLVERGLCSPAKREAVLAWPGQDSFWSAPKRWPAAAIGAPVFCVRGLSHVKVISHTDREPEAKIYLTFGPADRSGVAGAASSPASRSAFST